MRSYFRYDNGFVNVDDEHIYLTSSGNWGETKKLKEKSSTSVKENRRRINRISFFVYFVAGAVVFLLLYVFNNNGTSNLLYIALPVLGLRVYYYFKTDLGKRYKIPVAKIQAIEATNEGFEIQFTNLDGELDTEAITGIGARDAHVLQELKLKIFPLNEYLDAPQKGIE